MKTIGDTILRVPSEISDKLDIIVVNDGSTDKTYSIAKNLGSTVILFPNNKGNGASIRVGLNYCKKRNYDIVVTLDADGQHNPADILEFIKPIIYDILILW